MGLQIILRTQLRRDGKLTGWCQQYDEETLAAGQGEDVRASVGQWP